MDSDGELGTIAIILTWLVEVEVATICCGGKALLSFCHLIFPKFYQQVFLGLMIEPIWISDKELSMNDELANLGSLLGVIVDVIFPASSEPVAFSCIAPSAVNHHQNVADCILEIDVKQKVAQQVGFDDTVAGLPHGDVLAAHSKHDFAGVNPIHVDVEDFWLDVREFDDSSGILNPSLLQRESEEAGTRDEETLVDVKALRWCAHLH
jgi:hypothetical protein